MYDKRHGGPYDRGGADSYYRRGYEPHYYMGATYSSERVECLTKEELAAYKAGWEDNHEAGNFKEWD